MTSQTPIERKLTKARTQLLLNQPFFGSLCLRLKLVPAEVPTMATNGKLIVYSGEFVNSLTPAELEGVLAHEVMHCALAHHCRRGTRDPLLWNKAADFAINPIILNNGLALPADALDHPAYHGLSAEEIYSRLLQEGNDEGQQPAPPSGSHGGLGTNSPTAQPPQSGSGNSEATASGPINKEGKQTPVHPGGFGEVQDATDDSGNRASEAEIERQRHEWNIAAEQAVRSSKVCGHEPADVDRPLHEARESKQDWRAILRDFVGATNPSDYRWSPPNRRFVSSGLYLPSVNREGVGEIVIGVDTSGSIGDEELKQFAGEISAISDQANPAAIHVVYCDAAVQGTQEFLPSEPVVLEAKGGGGTDFRPVFEWVDAKGLAPVCLIYLTDLCCTAYPVPPAYPVLWVTDSRRIAPFGETVKITAD
ncbi:MAG TPA: VWA-like domain-containing protein [Candidatus Angelobacter sp.]|nr:VWA-like domain-containing protein [Candidatus Angelobacter sp.]